MSLHTARPNKAYLCARAFADSHLRGLVSELVLWKSTGLYTGHWLSDLAAIVQPISEHGSMRMAEDIVVEAALNYINQLPNKPN